MFEILQQILHCSNHQVVQKLVVQLPILNSLLDKLIERYKYSCLPVLPFLFSRPSSFRLSSHSSVVEKTYLLDVFTKLYIATDYDREGELIGHEALNILRLREIQATIRGVKEAIGFSRTH